jgi:hypothetical protein
MSAMVEIMQYKYSKSKFSAGFGLFWSQVSLCVNLPFEIDTYEIILFDLELAFDGIDEEGQLTAPEGILFRSALHLPERKLHTHLRQKLPRLLQADILRLLDHTRRHSFPSSAALR